MSFPSANLVSRSARDVIARAISLSITLSFSCALVRSFSYAAQASRSNRGLLT